MLTEEFILLMLGNLKYGYTNLARS